jgi:pimeloyl-ACP methyl ester carboxylesterase
MEKSTKTCIVVPGGPGIGDWIYSNYLPEGDEFEYIFFDQRPGLALEGWTEELVKLIEKSSSESVVSVIAHSSGGCLLSKALLKVHSKVRNAIFLACPLGLSVDSDFMEWFKNPNTDLLNELEITSRDLKIDLAGHSLPEQWRVDNLLANQFFDNWKMFFVDKNKILLKDFFEQTSFSAEVATSFYEKDFPGYNLLSDLEQLEGKIVYLYPENDQRITPNHVSPLFSHPKVDFKTLPGSHFCFVDESLRFKEILLEIIQIS